MYQFRKKAAIAVASLLGSLSTQAHATDAGGSVWWTDFGQHVHVQTGMGKYSVGTGVVFDATPEVVYGQGTGLSDSIETYKGMAEVSAQFGGTVLYDGRGVGLDYVADLNMDAGVIPVARYWKGTDFTDFARVRMGVADVLAQYTGTRLYDGRGVGLVHVAGVDLVRDVEPAISYSQEGAYAGFWANSVMPEALADYGNTRLYDGRGVGLQMAVLDAGMVASTAGW
jgi:hypothetical protein